MKSRSMAAKGCMLTGERLLLLGATVTISTEHQNKIIKLELKPKTLTGMAYTARVLCLDRGSGAKE